MDSPGDDTAEPAFPLLTHLHDLSSERMRAIEEYPTARQALVRLFDRILNTIARHHEFEGDGTAIPLLVFEPVEEPRALSDRDLAWYDATDTVWIPTSNLTGTSGTLE